MLLYFEFEGQRKKANVIWPRDSDRIVVHLNDKELATEFPTDLYYAVEEGRKVAFEPEDSSNERLLDLQNVIRRRLQEFTNKV